MMSQCLLESNSWTWWFKIAYEHFDHQTVIYSILMYCVVLKYCNSSTNSKLKGRSEWGMCERGRYCHYNCVSKGYFEKLCSKASSVYISNLNWYKVDIFNAVVECLIPYQYCGTSICQYIVAALLVIRMLKPGTSVFCSNDVTAMDPVFHTEWYTCV